MNNKIKKYTCLLVLTLGMVSSYAQEKKPVLPSAAHLQYQEMERTMFVSFDVCAWQGRDLDNHSVPLNRINPDQLDVNQWIDVAESFDAKMIMFVAKHVGGFCWWQTETTDYSVKNTPYKNGKGDVLDNLAKACFERGMKLGIYIYPGDETWGAYLGGSGRTKDPTKQEAYNQVLRKQWEEVLSRYGHQVAELFLDGGMIVPIEDIIQKYAPNAVAFLKTSSNVRWVGNERGLAPYPSWNTINSVDSKGNPDGDKWMPVEVDVPLKNHFWFWSPENHKNLRSVDELVEIYYKSVGRGATLLLNSAPDTTGRIPSEDVVIYKQFGEEIRRRFEKSLAETSGRGDTITLHLDNKTRINHLILEENIAFGERIRSFTIEGRNENEAEWFPIASGTAVGNKRILQFPDTEVTELRLHITESVYNPLVCHFAAYHVPGAIETSLVKEWDSNDLGDKNEISESEKWVSDFTTDKDGTFKVDLSPVILLPEQYEVTIRNKDKQLVPLLDGALFLQKIRTPGFSSLTPDGTYRISITALPTREKESIMIEGKIEKKRNKQEKYSLFIKSVY